VVGLKVVSARVTKRPFVVTILKIYTKVLEIYEKVLK
jgi:hypothetical protein